jgi:lipoprotein-anchoring transpeptidase ErfK/SrfK
MSRFLFLLALFAMSHSFASDWRQWVAEGRMLPEMPYLWVAVSEQKMFYKQQDKILATYPVSTAEKGIGSRAGSLQTPMGLHRVAERFGEGAALGTWFKARQSTGRVVEILTEPKKADGDYVTTRILWLEGLEPGINQGRDAQGQVVDSYRRYIYIHGTPEEGLIGQPASHGCVRMLNADVIELFEKVPVGTLVYIAP